MRDGRVDVRTIQLLCLVIRKQCKNENDTLQNGSVIVGAQVLQMVAIKIQHIYNHKEDFHFTVLSLKLSTVIIMVGKGSNEARHVLG